VSTSWAYVAGDGTAEVKVLVSPAIEPNGGQDWVLKLESPVEMFQVTIGFDDPDQSYWLLGCDPTDCCPGSCTAGVCDVANPMLGPSVDACASHEGYLSLYGTHYVVLQGNLTSEDYPAIVDPTLLHVPYSPSPSRVTLGTLRIPESEALAGVQPGFRFDGITQPFELPGGGDYPDPVDLTGSGERSEDADADRISNDTDNCVVYANADQVDVGGLVRMGQPVPPFDGWGDGCQCGDALGDGQIAPAGFQGPSDPGDVGVLQQVLAGLPLDPDPELAAALAQAARARCSVSGTATGGGEPSDCDIKDVLTLALAIENQGPGISAVCARNTPDQPQDP
jgi:hypothetical protein